MFQSKKKYYKAVAAVLLSASLLTGCSSSDSETTSSGIYVETQKAGYGTLEVTGTYIGTVAPNNSVNVTPLVSGTVTEVNVKVGDTVKEGDVLCQFDDTAADLQVESAQSSVDSAEASKDAAEEQIDSATSQSQSSIDTLYDTLSSYQKSLSSAKEQLEDLKTARKKLKTAMNQAQTAAEAAKQTYKSAQTLYVNYQTFLSANPDCQTTAGLTAAATAVTTDEEGNVDATAAEKASTATALMSSLSSAGVTVEYLSDSGLTSLKETADDAETAYSTASTNYEQTVSSIATVKSSIETLNSQIDATKSSISSAEDALSSSSTSTDVYDAQIAAAEIGVDSAEYQKSLYTVTAPIDGVVEAVNVSENELASTGYTAFTISSEDSMLVTFYVTEEVKDFLQIGNSVEVDNNGTTYRGSVSSIGTAVDSTKGLFKVEAQIYFNENNAMSSGISVSLSVVTSEAANSIIIPYDAVYYDDNQSYVYYVDDGVAVRKDITTGLYNDDSIVVTSGLDVGEEVITTSASGLKDGALIATPDGSDDTDENEKDAITDDVDENDSADDVSDNNASDSDNADENDSGDGDADENTSEDDDSENDKQDTDEEAEE
ncbi:MAG: efflux RND transporter periplasmic adaptor subunit [Clostridiales bacterium]|nr:efflux RND transporter periplasmic adaptor subunit [Clostridiales bacterium]